MDNYWKKSKIWNFSFEKDIWGFSDFYGYSGLNGVFFSNRGGRIFRWLVQNLISLFGNTISLFFYFIFVITFDSFFVCYFYKDIFYKPNRVSLLFWEFSDLPYILVLLALLLSLVFVFNWIRYQKSYIGAHWTMFSSIIGLYLFFLVYGYFYQNNCGFNLLSFWRVGDIREIFDYSLDLIGLEIGHIGLTLYFFLISIFLVLFMLARLLWGAIFNERRRFFIQNHLIDQILLSFLVLIFSGCMLYSANLFFLFINWVGLNIALYGLLGQFSFSLKAQESAIKYFTLGLVAAGFFLFGLLLIYYIFGFLDIISISAALGVVPYGSTPGLVLVGVLLIFSVVLFKLSAFPFQAWALDVYEGASWFSLSILVLVVKPVFVLIMIRLLFLFSSLNTFSSVFIFISGCVSIFIGTVGGAFQQKIKRFLAMSSISHVGFVLMILALNPTNPILALNYLMGYVVANAILILILSSLRISGPLHPVARSLVYWSELIFLNGHTPFRVFYTWYLSIALFSLAGLPPFFGFFTKLGFFLLCFTKLSILSLIGGFVAFLLLPISVFSYLRIIRLFWFGDCNPFSLIFFVRVISGNWLHLVIFVLSLFIVFGSIFIL